MSRREQLSTIIDLTTEIRKLKEEQQKIIGDKIAASQTPEELYKVMRDAGLAHTQASTGTIEGAIDYSKYVPEYVQKRAAKEKKKNPRVKPDPDAGKPFTPPLRTSDVAGL